MKSEIYNALGAINRGFDVVLELLTILQQEGVVNVEHVQQQTEITEEVRAGLNHMILERKHEKSPIGRISENCGMPQRCGLTFSTII